MDDSELREFFPKYGDRIKIREFCEGSGIQDLQSNSPSSSRKDEILHRLRRKLSICSSSKRPLISSKTMVIPEKRKKEFSLVGNMNSQKVPERLISVGCITLMVHISRLKS